MRLGLLAVGDMHPSPAGTVANREGHEPPPRELLAGAAVITKGISVLE